MKPSIPQVLPLVIRYLETHPAGGALHIVLEDGNVSDDDVLFCYDHALHGPRWQAYQDYITAKFGPRRPPLHEPDDIDHDGAALALILLAMSKTQRLKLSRMA